MRFALISVVGVASCFLAACFLALLRVAHEERLATQRLERDRREMAEGWQRWSERVRADEGGEIS